MRYIEKQFVLQSLDHLWREHLVTLDHLRQVVGWRGMAQRDPLNEYKSEAFELFNVLITHLRELTTSQLSRVEVIFEPPANLIQPPQFAAFDQSPPPDGVLGAGFRRIEQRAGVAKPGALVRRERGGVDRFVRARGRRRSGGGRQSRAQPALPLRVRPQIQTLPRRARLTRGSGL